MSIDKTNFESIDEKDLNELIDVEVPEGVRLDYKLTQYGNSDKDKREVLKDVSSFSNTQGGHLIIGMGEAEGVASDIPGIDVDADSEILRMEQIIRSGTEPSISNVKIKSISLENGSKVIILRIPKSWHPPHRVVSQNVNRFYMRHSAGVHEPGVEELRMLFSQSSEAVEKARKFRDFRINEILLNKGMRPLEGSGRLILHVIPVASLMGAVSIDVEEFYNNQNHHDFWPFATTGMSPRFNYEGVINDIGGEKNYGYTQIYRNGIIEAVKKNIVREHEDYKFIPGQRLEKYLFERFDKYIDGLKKLNVPTPLIVLITLEGVHGCVYRVDDNRWGDQEYPLTEDILSLPEGLIEDYGSVESYHKSVKRAFDTLWNAAGYSSSQFFDATGRWTGVMK